MADTIAYQEQFALTNDKYTGPSGTTFACNICDRPVDDGPCPDHAPTAAPGMRLVDCDAEPRHMLWVLDRDDYGVPCFQCAWERQAEAERQARQCRHWGWRTWRITDWASRTAYRLGITTGGGYIYGDGHNGCLTGVRFRGPRLYILGVSRDTWRCWLSSRGRKWGAR